eukprot:4092087-Pyramimonas_sp.AAC.1
MTQIGRQRPAQTGERAEHPDGWGRARRPALGRLAGETGGGTEGRSRQPTFGGEARTSGEAQRKTTARMAIAKRSLHAWA